MITSQTIRCSNCGNYAQRHFVDRSIIRTSCQACDYLLVQCAKTGKVIEAYAPGVPYLSVS
jgi:ribosomal protein L32